MRFASARPPTFSDAMRIVATAVVGVLPLLSACSMLRSRPEPAEVTKAPAAPAGQVATLRAIGGSAVLGKIRVIDRGDGATMLVSAINVGGDVRIAIHRDPNCSSPNGFSAGPAWAPPGKRPQDLVPAQHANSEDRIETELHIAGLRTGGADGVAGRSVVLYAGRNVTDARPDVPNERIACGVFEPAQPLSF